MIQKEWLSKYTILISLCLAVFLLASCSEEESEDDPRLWSHDKLMAGANVVNLNDVLPGYNDEYPVKILFLEGNNYQMGYQHGYLMQDQLAGVKDTTTNVFPWAQAFTLARTKFPLGDDRSYIDLIEENTLDYVLEECEGLVAGSYQIIDMDICLAYNSITYILEDLIPRYAPDIGAAMECSGFVARGAATADGAGSETVIQGRNLDWLAIDFIMESPLVIVRQPTSGTKVISLAFPGFIGTLTGINEYGVTVGMDENSCKLEEYRDLFGTPPLQIQLDILNSAKTVSEAESIISGTDQATCQMFIISDANGDGGVFEMWAQGYNLRQLGDTGSEDVIFATNHFEHPDSYAIQNNRDILDLNDNSVARYYRLSERLTGATLSPHTPLTESDPDYAYGKIDVNVAIDIMRDPVDMRPDNNRIMFPCQEHENGNWALGNNHNVHSAIVFPNKQQFYYAAGWDDECENSIYNPYIGFDINDLIDGDYDPSLMGDPIDPPYNDSYGNGTHPLP